MSDELDELRNECRWARNTLVDALRTLDDALKAADEELLAKAELRDLESAWRHRVRQDQHRKPPRPTFGGEDQ